jgi:DNA-binding transcriptional ArsR family regulator
MGPDPAQEAAVRVVTVTDPRAIRALSHPARLQIFMRLVTEGPATATDCASLTRLSASACSYHLRHLSKYGFVAQDPTAGRTDQRERVWRPLADEFVLDVDDAPSMPVRRANQALGRTFIEYASRQALRWAETADDDPVDWMHASGVSARVLRLTVEELDALRTQLDELMHPYLHRTRVEDADGAEGSRLVDAAIFLTPRTS